MQCRYMNSMKICKQDLKQEVKSMKITVKMHARIISSNMLQMKRMNIFIFQQENVKAVAHYLL